MNDQCIDDRARLTSEAPMPRRGVLGLLTGALLGGPLALLGLDAEAGKKGKKKRKKKKKGERECPHSCTSDADCCDAACCKFPGALDGYCCPPASPYCHRFKQDTILACLDYLQTTGF
jgi:hypothetical protein